MKFHVLTVKNFISIGDAEIGLDGKGLNLIQGVNDDETSASSNGAGKSSLVDGLCWCLFGVTARGVKGDAVVNRERKKDTAVKLTMSNGASGYRVERYRKHKEFKNSLRLYAIAGDDTPAIELSRGTDAETQKALEDILGCSYEIFMAAVYCGQDVMPDLPRLGDRDLKRLIEEASGLQRIERAYEISRERALTARSAASSAATHRETIGTQVERHRIDLANRVELRDLWEEGRAERVLEANNLYIVAQGDLTAGLHATLAVAPQALAAQAEIDKLDLQLADASSLRSKHTEAVAACSAAERAVPAARLQEMARGILAIKKELENPAAAVSKPCGACGTVLSTMSIEDFVTHKTKHLNAAVEELNTLKAKAVELVAVWRKAQAAVLAAEAEIPDVSEITATKKELAATVTTHSNFKDAARLLATESKAALESLHRRQKEINPEQSAVEMLEGQLAASISAAAASSETLTLANERAQIAEAVVKVFGPAGVRAQILDTVTPYLNDRTADYLSVLSDGSITATWTTLTRAASGDLKEKFGIEVTNEKGADSFLGLSGGEKRKVRISTALALQDLVASRAVQPIDLWIGDEVDDALDVSGLERLMTILERRARERGTVLVISHNELRDWCDDVTVVRKTGGISQVEGSLCV